MVEISIMHAKIEPGRRTVTLVGDKPHNPGQRDVVTLSYALIASVSVRSCATPSSMLEICGPGFMVCATMDPRDSDADWEVIQSRGHKACLVAASDIKARMEAV